MRSTYARTNQWRRRDAPAPSYRAQAQRQSALARPIMNRPPEWLDYPEIFVKLYNLPRSTVALDVYRLIKQRGNPTYIDVFEPWSSMSQCEARVKFNPPPRDWHWISEGLYVRVGNGSVQHIRCEVQIPKPSPRDTIFEESKANAGERQYPREMAVQAEYVLFGVMRDENTMCEMQKTDTTTRVPVQMSVNLERKHMGLRFSIQDLRGNTRVFRMRLPFTQIKGMHHSKDMDKRSRIHIAMQAPPEVFRESDNVESTFDAGEKSWNIQRSWFRQTIIDANPEPGEAVTGLPQKDAILDIGRWLDYQLSFHPNVAGSQTYSTLFQALQDYNIKPLVDGPPNTVKSNSRAQWEIVDSPAPKDPDDRQNTFLTDMHQMLAAYYLPFDVRFHLEVCISQGVLHECNLDAEFLHELSIMEPSRAVKLLQKAADFDNRTYQPQEILQLQGRITMLPKKLPKYCTTIRSATVTPTTIIFSTPVPETSNRVVRHFKQYEDRFLRVRFTDERHRGRLTLGNDHSSVELLTRIKRTMKNGIQIGDRHFHFLAFGSSQFREHGAYFFASTPAVNAESIRAWMGDFKNIRVVAKYCARLGQCFSTTRAITSSGVRLVRIPDIERNGHTFTDGVGKISPFLAYMIAQELNLPNCDTDVPTVFQFRLAGCKGVLAVDPMLKGKDVCIRPSQEKFPSAYEGLEICRISQFGAAYLNQQIILVLSALGVPDAVFNKKLKNMLRDIESAMTDQSKALELLRRNVDHNQMSITIASMICDGFMTVQDPFMISCLRLWQAWNTKYLKEKARIHIERGAFLLGCVDETATLRGHFLDDEDLLSASSPLDTLAEIFVQISDSHSSGRYRIIEGICFVARNPSLHPGDVRVVRAVDKPGLRHLKNCVVFPQTGDRDLPSMCSGGDLDGDDFFVVWDNELLPQEWNHNPMDYSGPKPVESVGPVTVDDMTTFFVNYIKDNKLSQIAVRHRCWADYDEDGIKSDECIKLASLHSLAVDFCKTGVPAEMGPEFKLKAGKPHWAVGGRKGTSKTYHSKKILGQLFDSVERKEFAPVWDLPFDDRITNAFELSEQLLRDAREIKTMYDEAVGRLMAQHGIGTEFEIWTTFALDHNQDTGDYKFAETLGELVMALKDQHQAICYEKAGTSAKERDFKKLGPFVAAMYKVTADEVASALQECEKVVLVGGIYKPARMKIAKSMPLISFPWIFQHELGRIATGKIGLGRPVPLPERSTHERFKDSGRPSAPVATRHVEPVEVVDSTNKLIQFGDLLNLHGDDALPGPSSVTHGPLGHEKNPGADSGDCAKKLDESVNTVLHAGEDIEGLEEVEVEGKEENEEEEVVVKLDMEAMAASPWAKFDELMAR